MPGLLAARHGDAKQADEHLADAIRELREIDAPYVLAQVLLERAELMHAEGSAHDTASLLNEATEIFARLRATPCLERAQELHPQVSLTP